MQMLFWRTDFEDGMWPTPGGLLQPQTYNFYYYPELLLISNVKPIGKYLAFEPRIGTKCPAPLTGSTHRRENRKILHENVILKSNERLHWL
jgi:hypothetical protein